MTEISGRITQIQIKDKGDGITHALLKHVKQEKLELSDGTISKAEWRETIKVLDKIQANRKANNQSSIFGKNYLVKQGDNIDFTEDEMNMLYKAMGVKLSDKPVQSQQIPEEAVVPVVPQSEPEVTGQTQQPAQSAQVPVSELPQQLNTSSQNSVLEDAVPTSDALSSDEQSWVVDGKIEMTMTEEQSQQDINFQKAQLERYNQAIMYNFDENVKVDYDAAKNEYNCKGFKTNISADFAKSLARVEMQFLVDNRETYLELIKKDPDEYTIDEFGIVKQFELDLKMMNMRLDDTGLFEDIKE